MAMLIKGYLIISCISAVVMAILIYIAPIAGDEQAGKLLKH